MNQSIECSYSSDGSGNSDDSENDKDNDTEDNDDNDDRSPCKFTAYSSIYRVSKNRFIKEPIER